MNIFDEPDKMETLKTCHKVATKEKQLIATPAVPPTTVITLTPQFASTDLSISSFSQFSSYSSQPQPSSSVPKLPKRVGLGKHSQSSYVARGQFKFSTPRRKSKLTQPNFIDAETPDHFPKKIQTDV